MTYASELLLPEPRPFQALMEIFDTRGGMAAARRGGGEFVRVVPLASAWLLVLAGVTELGGS